MLRDWDEDVTQRVQKLHERIEPIFCWRRRIFSTYLSDSTPSVLFSRFLHFGNPAIFLYFDYSIDVIEIHVPFTRCNGTGRRGLERI